MSFHHTFLAELDAALMAGSISTTYHYEAKRVLRAANMSGRPLRTLEEVAQHIRELRANGGMTKRQVYNPRYS